MNGIEAVTLRCPYCGETIEVLVDCSVPVQRYTEDCQVCCRPMILKTTLGDDGLPTVEASKENSP
jgi:hypothetical protein